MISGANNPFNGSTGFVDKQLGESYRTVKKVSDNLTKIAAVEAVLGDIEDIGGIVGAYNAASASAEAAEAKALEASGSASAAATSEANANVAAASASAASNSAASHSSQAIQAASDADACRVAAETARDAALAAYDDFDDRYLGPKITPPTTDNDGNPLLPGALYYDMSTSPGSMMLYTGMEFGWVAAYVTGGSFAPLEHTHTISDVTDLAATLGTKLDSSLVSPFALTILDDTSDVAVRSTLGLGSAATADSAAFAPTSHSHDISAVTGLQSALDGKISTAEIGNSVQAYDQDLQAISSLAGTAGLLRKTGANSWGLDTSAYLTSVTAADISGTISVTNGGTGASSASQARSNLGLAIGSDVQAFDPDLSAIAALGTTSFGRSLLTQVSAADALATLTANAALTFTTNAYGKFMAIPVGGITIYLQWGTGTSGANGWSANFLLPQAFTNSGLIVCSSTDLNVTAADGNNVAARLVGLNQYQLGSDDSARNINWVAIGY